MDNGSSSNCCSIRLVEMLKLVKNEDGDIIVKNQLKIQFSIGNYKDGVLCNIVPMNNCHILLGRSLAF